jgi:hypothetical protein
MLRIGENSLKALAKRFSRPFVQPSKAAGKKQQVKPLKILLTFIEFKGISSSRNHLLKLS